MTPTIFSGSRFAGALASALIVMGNAPAQRAAADPRPRTATSAHGWMQSSQEADGHWPAARQERDLRATSLMVLALLADGNTPAVGPFSGELARGVAWLVEQQVGHGRFGVHMAPDWILDHAMATYAVCEAGRLGKIPELGPIIAPAVDALTRHLTLQSQPEPEILLWSTLVARSREEYERVLREPEHDGMEREESAGEPLLREVDRLRPEGIPLQLRQRAALLLLERLRSTSDPYRLTELAAPFQEAGWPGPVDMEDPLTVLYFGAFCYKQGKRSWKDFSRSLTRPLIATQIQKGALRGTWEPEGAFGKDGGRACTTAVMGILTTLYYRYCNLLVASE